MKEPKSPQNCKIKRSIQPLKIIQDFMDSADLAIDVPFFTKTQVLIMLYFCKKHNLYLGDDIYGTMHVLAVNQTSYQLHVAGR